MNKRRWFYVLAAAIPLVLAAILSLKVDFEASTFAFAEPAGFAKFLYDLCQQLFVAVILSAAIYEALEVAYAKRMAKMEEDAFKRTFAQGISSAFSTFYDDGIIKKLTDSVFASPLVREDFKVDYELADLEDFEGHCVFDTTYTYALRNAGTMASVYSIQSLISSNFAAYELDDKPCPEIVELEIAGKPVTPAQLEKLNKALDANLDTTRLDAGKRIIEPNATLHIKWKIRTHKQTCDSETFRSHFPACDLHITFKNNSSKAIKAAVSAIGDYALPSLSLGAHGVYHSECKEATLPYYGWVLFWNDTKRFC